MRLIDADALVKRMEATCSATQFGRGTAKMCIKEAPTIDPVNHGWWTMDVRNGWDCSECGRNPIENIDADVWSDFRPPFCPHCGAKMDKEV